MKKFDSRKHVELELFDFLVKLAKKKINENETFVLCLEMSETIKFPSFIQIKKESLKNNREIYYITFLEKRINHLKKK